MSTRDNEPAGSEGSVGHDQGDWSAIESSPEFARLVSARRRVVIPSLVVFGAWFGTFIALAAWGHSVMRSEIVSGFSVAYAMALSLIAMTWLLAFVYIRASNRRIDPLDKDVVRAAQARAWAAPGDRGAAAPGPHGEKVAP